MLSEYERLSLLALVEIIEVLEAIRLPSRSENWAARRRVKAMIREATAETEAT